MPEGPEIRRAADTLEAAIKDEPLTDVWFAFPRLQPYQTELIGQRVTHIDTRGKADVYKRQDQRTVGAEQGVSVVIIIFELIGEIEDQQGAHAVEAKIFPDLQRHDVVDRPRLR